MAQTAGLKDYRKQGAPADIGTFQVPATAMVFQFTFSGTQYTVAMGMGMDAWTLIAQNPSGADQVEIGAATAYVGGLGGGLLFINRGAYVKTDVAGIDIPSNVKVEMTPDTTITLADEVGNVPYIFRGTDAENIVIRGGVLDGNRAGQTTTTGNAFAIAWSRVIDSWIEDVTIRGMSTNDANSGYGIYLNDSQRNKIIGNNVDNCSRENIVVFNDSDHNIIDGNIFQNCDDRNFVCHNSNHSIVTNNVSLNSGGHGFEFAHDTGATGNICNNNIILGSGTEGINIEDNDDFTITGNVIDGSAMQGILLDPECENVLTNGNMIKNNGGGISSRAEHLLISDNIFINNGGAGGGASNGITMGVTAGPTFIVDNIFRKGDDQQYGIRIHGGSVDTRVFRNDIADGGTIANFRDDGTDTKLATIPIQLIQGTTFISTAGEAWGWEISADTNFALGIGWLPLEVQQVVRIRVIGVALAAPGVGNYMRIQITGEGGTFGESFATEPIDVVDKDNNATDPAIDEPIQWIFTPTDDADIGHLLGGDRLQIKVLHEGAGGTDIATNAIVDTIQVEVV